MQTAQQIKEPAAGAEANASGDQLLTFMLAGEEYGVDILRVQEIRGWGASTRVPRTPDYVRGIINLRGMIVPIIDLRERFGLETIEYGPTTVVIVLKTHFDEKERTMGIVVDAVSDVHNVGAAELQAPPDFGSGVDTRFIYAMTFGLGAALAGLTGGLYAPTMTMVPTMGTTFIMEAFVTVVVGGADVFLGTAPAAAVLAVVKATLTSWYGQLFGQIGLLIAVIIVIRVLPRGISGFILRERA